MDTKRFLADLSALFTSGQKEQVSDYLRSSLAKAQNKSDDYAAVTILNEMINYYRITSDHHESIKAAEQALSLMSRLGGYEQTAHYGTTLVNTVTAYKAAGNTPKVLELFNAALDIYLRELPTQDARLTALYNNLSTIYQNVSEYEKSASYLKKSTDILSQIKGAELDQATVYTNLALALFALGREPEPMQTLQKALEIFQNTTPNGKVDTKVAPLYASTLAGLAYACYKMHNYAQAAELYEEAWARIKEVYGKNDDYFLTCCNCATAFEAAGNASKAAAYRSLAEGNPFAGKANVITSGTKKNVGKGMELARAYYAAYGQDLLSRFPALEKRVAAGLVGEGSECFGFDDEISQDHDFGPSFCLWLMRKDFQAIGTELQKAYEALPKEFMGYAARLESSPHAGRRVGVLCVEDFYRHFTGRENANLRVLDWLHLPENSLAIVTNGEVFSDPLGEFLRIRDGFLAYYPEDIWLKKIAARAALMSQAGQSNYSRCMSRGENVAAYMALGEFVKQASSMVFLLNKRYAPFYKWTHRAMRELEVLPEAAELLARLITAGLDPSKWKFAAPAEMAHTINERDENVVLIERLCGLVKDKLRSEGLSHINDDFLLPHAEAVSAKIKDGAIRSLHIMEG